MRKNIVTDMFSNITNIYAVFELLGAKENTENNAAKHYLKGYASFRKNFEDKDDPTFQLYMSALATTSFIKDKDSLDSMAESVYLLERKFSHLDDVYKISIM